MSTPIVAIFGQAGSGKDTLADHLTQQYGFVRLAFADELKRFVGRVFDFSEEQLWGPSASRNQPDPRYAMGRKWAWAVAETFFAQQVGTWLTLLLPPQIDRDFAQSRAVEWFEACRRMEQFSPRLALQTLGTEFGRNVHRDLWLNLALAQAKRLILQPGLTYDRKVGVVLAEGATPCRGVSIADARFDNERVGVQAVGGVALRLHRAGVTGEVGITGHASEAELKSIPDGAFDCVIRVEEGIERFRRQIDTVMEIGLGVAREPQR